MCLGCSREAELSLEVKLRSIRAGNGRRGFCLSREGRNRFQDARSSEPRQRQAAGQALSPAGSPTSSKPIIPELPGTHSQAGTSSRKSAFCVRSRCRSCRTMWPFQTAAGAQGSQGAPGPAMAAHSSSPSRRGGASRGLQDVRAAAAGNPRLYQACLSGRSGHLKAGAAVAQPKPSAQKEQVSVLG